MTDKEGQNTVVPSLLLSAETNNLMFQEIWNNEFQRFAAVRLF
jgi:hypothetical protein